MVEAKSKRKSEGNSTEVGVRKKATKDSTTPKLRSISTETSSNVSTLRFSLGSLLLGEESLPE
jgi:hypothetical protein